MSLRCHSSEQQLSSKIWVDDLLGSMYTAPSTTSIQPTLHELASRPLGHWGFLPLPGWSFCAYWWWPYITVQHIAVDINLYQPCHSLHQMDINWGGDHDVLPQIGDDRRDMAGTVEHSFTSSSLSAPSIFFKCIVFSSSASANIIHWGMWVLSGLFLICSNFYLLDLHNKTCGSLANLRWSIS